MSAIAVQEADAIHAAQARMSPPSRTRLRARRRVERRRDVEPRHRCRMVEDVPHDRDHGFRHPPVERLIGQLMEGDVVGTANYMSPEQARGKTVDRRTDIWAFGCVLFEMLTHSRAFTRNSWSDAVAVDDEPDWNLLERSAPPGLARLIRRCLATDPGERLRDAGDARLELRALAHEPVPAASRRVGPAPWMLVAAPGGGLATG